MISAKHVDLVLCEPHGGHILMAIELDDRSHRRGDRFVDRAFASAEVPLVRYPAKGRFDVSDIRAQLSPYLKLTEEGPAAC